LLTTLNKATVALFVCVMISLAASLFAHMAPAQDQSEAKETKEAPKRASGATQARTEKKRGELDLTGRSDVIAVDLVNRLITGHELIALDGDRGSRLGRGLLETFGRADYGNSY
jgi:hypothetical protein